MNIRAGEEMRDGEPEHARMNTILTSSDAIDTPQAFYRASISTDIVASNRSSKQFRADAR